MPATWKLYGVDANHDGRKDPYNPVDAIFAAARYLKAAGAEHGHPQAPSSPTTTPTGTSTRVLLRARLIGGLPADLVGSLTGLTQGHFPVDAKARYADDIAERDRPRKRVEGRATPPSRSSATPTRRGDQHLRQGRLAGHRRPGRPDRQDRARRPRSASFIMLRDVYGNTYTYAHLKKLAARATRCPKPQTVTAGAQVAKRARAARAATRSRPRPATRRRSRRARRRPPRRAPGRAAPRRRAPRRRSPRSACSPTRTARPLQRAAARSSSSTAARALAGCTTFKRYFTEVSASTATTSCSSRSRRARRSSPARSSAASARPTPRRAPHVALRDPPGRPRRAAHRPEADPRRLEAARVHGDLPRRRARTRSSAPTPRTRRSARSC